MNHKIIFFFIRQILSTSDHLPVYIEFKNINLKEQIGGYNNLIELLDKKIIKYQNLQDNKKLIYYKNY